MIESYRGIVLRLAACGALAALAACGSGEGGLNGDQDPDAYVLHEPIAYTKGPLPEPSALGALADLRRLDRFNVGTDLYLRDRGSASAAERNLTEPITQGRGDVRDVSYGSGRLLFALRGPHDANAPDDAQPTWNLWEYRIRSASLQRLIEDDATAEAGHDIAPQALPDGRIVFASTRQSGANAQREAAGEPAFAALTEDLAEPAFVLHVMDADGTNIRQISFNQSHDYDPVVLGDGRILFSRWDNAGGASGIHLYTIHPDGSELKLLYGAESHATGTSGSEIQFTGARELPDGRVLSVIRPFVHEGLGGALVAIDTQTYVENTQPTAANAGLAGPAQRPAVPGVVSTDASLSPGGRFGSAYALGDGRLLVTWAACRAVDPDASDTAYVACTDERFADAEPAPPAYGIWVFGGADGTQLPLVVGEEGVLIDDVIAIEGLSAPALPDKQPGLDLDAGLAAESAGVLNIRSVYDIHGVDTAVPDIATLADPAATTAADRPARFLRVVKAVGIPGDDVAALDATAFGPDLDRGMREIVAYAPVEPDGSVRVKVPARTPLAVSVLDADGRRISAPHRNWLQVLPGEELTCNGCHDPASGLSHGRPGSFDPAWAGAAATGVPFPNTVASLPPEFGETMAETRTRVSCELDHCAALEPSLDIVYEDVWTDPDVRAPDAPFAYTYASLTTPAPAPADCLADWRADCGAVIHYETHIHPLWDLLRQERDENGTLVADNTCTQSGCHAPVAANAPAVPAAQLDLTDGPSPDEPAQLNAYRELLHEDFEQELVMGEFRDVVVTTGSTDEDGVPITTNIALRPPMSAEGAHASGAFFDVFAPGASHEGYLSPAELKLIAEWLDIGAQYYNDPFAVPLN